MEVKSEKKIKFNYDKSYIWEKIIDPSFMVKSVPGAELIEKIDESHFRGKISIKIGPVSVNFNGEAEFTKIDKKNNELTMVGNGLDKSGKGGSRLTMDIKLLPIKKGETEMLSIMKVSITGRIAQFGSRMIVAVNNKMFDQWSKNFADLLNENSIPNQTSDNLKTKK